MRIEVSGDDHVQVGTDADEVAATLADPDELLAILDGLLRPSSTPRRWVMAEMAVANARLTPAVDVDVERPEDRRVTVEGRPVEGHTPARLDVDMTARPDGDACTIATRWRVSVDVPGPQLLATTIWPLVSASARRGVRRIGDRLRDRFDRP